jgi:O-antigen ligase
VTLTLIVLTAAVGLAIVRHGGDDAISTSATLLLVSLAALYEFSARAARPRTETEAPRFEWLALLVPAYVALQLVPLPVSLLEKLSPARAEIARALEPLNAGSPFASISISLPTTWTNLSRIVCCALVFGAIRRLRARDSLGSWRAAIPLMLLGALESVWGFAGNSAPDGHMSGTYYSKNHFAGLLEMTMPFAAIYAFAVVRRGRTRHGLSARAAGGGSLVLAGALLMFASITWSLSKAGVVAMFCSMLAMGLLAAGRHLSGRRRVAAFITLALATLVIFLFFTPTRLVEAFAVLAGDQTEGRLPIWRNTLSLIAAYPIAGVGLGNFYPGLLPYQTYSNELAWVHAHNDYLQLFAELGIVGAFLLAALMALVSWRAVRTALFERSREEYLLALACSGALAAFAVHSLADFNAYVFANGLILAWISGIAFSLERSRQARQPASHAPAPNGGIRRIAAVAVVGPMVIWSGASLMFFLNDRSNQEIERSFCRFGICDTLAALVPRAPDGSVEDLVRLPPEMMQSYLRRDPADPNRWQEMGAACLAANRLDLARYCFSRSLELAPRSPSIALTAADFRFDIGEEPSALELLARALAQGERSDQAVFADLDYRKTPIDRVTARALPDRRAAQGYLRHLITAGRPDDARQLWRWMTSRAYADDVAAAGYFGLLVAQERSDAASEDWIEYVAGRDREYPHGNRVFNGGFEFDPKGSPFDWRLAGSAGVAPGFETNVHHANGRSLRLRFDGTANPADLGVDQLVYLPAGQYELSAWSKADGVTTDQGVFVKLTGAGRDVSTEPVRGTTDWREAVQPFTMAAGGLVRLHVERNRSLKFDNLVSGTVWLDDIAIRPSTFQAARQAH